ncbi:UNVERIFIED_CONTAM: hypothetical protein Slati_3640500 [Sesamum latifolium]|uniref:Uncharacterized protein n=1 Tax=Sesamum latifolium TaxID=2727402 RepID=A0AAW2U207_9LAMI
MSRFAEISSLFAALASNLQTQDPMATNDVDLSISDLNRSLNLSEAPRVRILDTALSLMCFTAPKVYDSVIEFTVKTIVAVLSSSVECKVLRTNKERVLRVGGLVSRSDCANVMETCADILGKLEGRKDDLCALLLYAVIRVAALAPCFARPIRSTSNLEVKFSDSSTSALANLCCHLPDAVRVKDGEVPLRILRGCVPILFRIGTGPSSIKQQIVITLRNGCEIKGLLRALALHNRGLASVMELQIEFVGQVLDVISRPMWWDISMEVASKLPFSHAYFPHEHHLLRILAGPMSEEYFQNLIDKISAARSHTGVHSVTSLKKAATKINIVDQVYVGYGDELPRLRLHDKDGITSPELDGWTVWLWLKEFRDMYIKVFGKRVDLMTSNTKKFSIHQNMLLRRIPLGILLVYANHLNAAGCALLLHYAATGTVQKFSDKQNSGLNQKRWKYDLQGDSMTWIEQYTEAEAIAGCKTVFDVTEVTERISPSMFETEEGLNFVCQLKLKSGKYLLKCIKRLLQVKLDGDGLQMQRDLLTRVIRWRHQGKDVFQNNKDLDYVCDALNV